MKENLPLSNSQYQSQSQISIEVPLSKESSLRKLLAINVTELERKARKISNLVVLVVEKASV